MSETVVADLSPGTVLVARSTGWRYRVQAVDPNTDRVILCGPRGSLAVSYQETQRDIANSRIGVRGSESGIAVAPFTIDCETFDPN
jgi:hypothetical protein